MEFKDFRSKFSVKTLLNNTVFKKKYILDCQKYKEFNNKRKFDCINERRYLDLGIDKEKLNLVTITKNKHQPGENLRAYYEFQNSKFFKEEDGCFVKDIIDVGPSNRLNINGIARLLVAPYCDLSDFTRHNKFDEQKSLIMNCKFQDFVKDYKEIINQWDVIYNFTDVLYYIDLKIEHFNKEGIVGCGTMHLYKYDGQLRFDKEFGSIKKNDDGDLIMIADGNMSYYKHASKYEDLINQDSLCIDKSGDKKLYIVKEQFADCGATAYIRYSLVVTKIDHVPRVIKMTLDENIKNIYIGVEPYDAEIIDFDKRKVKVYVDLEIMDKLRSVLNYLLLHGKSPTKLDMYRRATIECLKLKRIEILMIVEVLFKQEKLNEKEIAENF